MQREVLDPLGMTHSSFTWRTDQRSRTATGYDVDGRAVPRSALTEQAAGGLHTTVKDLAVFAAAGMTGPRGEPAGRSVLTPKGVAALFARRRLPDGSTTSLGYEVQTLPDGTDAAGHGGKNIGWRAEFLTLPDRREGLVVLTNSDRLDGILGLTEQAWRDWLGTGPPMTSQMQQSTLQPLYTHCSSSSPAPCCSPRRSAWRSLGDARGRGAGSGSGAILAVPVPSAGRCEASLSLRR